MRVPSVLAVVLIIALAGCVSGSDSPKSTSVAPSSEPAAAPSPTVEMGSISGLLVDEEALPKSDVRILLRPGENTTRTDAGGRFTFNDLAPGAYELHVSILGYETVAKKVEVAAGEITEITITLVALVVVVPYETPFTFTGHITAGQAFADIITGGLGLPGCDKCNQNFTAPADVLAVVLELDFSPTVANPAGKTVLGYQIHDPGTTLDATDEKTYFRVGEWGPGDRVQLNREDFSHLWPDEGNDFLMVHYCSATWVCAEQTFTVYGTFFHNSMPPANFTALPE